METVDFIWPQNITVSTHDHTDDDDDSNWKPHFV